MNRRPLVRSLLASAAIFAAVALAGCDTDTIATPTLRSLQPLSPQMIAEIEKRNMGKEAPILVRIFTEESELEVGKEDQSGRIPQELLLLLIVDLAEKRNVGRREQRLDLAFEVLLVDGIHFGGDAEFHP